MEKICKEELKKYNRIRVIISVLFIVVTIIGLLTNSTYALIFDIAIFICYLIIVIKEIMIIDSYKQIDAYFNLRKRFTRLNDKERVKELDENLTDSQRKRIECMRKLKLVQSSKQEKSS